MTLAFERAKRCYFRATSAVAALGASAILCAAPAARADDAELRTAARDLATQGAEAFEQGRYVEASDLFGRAHELVSAPSIALLQARSLAKIGRLLEAIDIYEQTAHFKLSEGAPEAYAHAVETAHSEVEEVRKRLPRLKLTLVGVAPGDTPRVTIDDKPTPPALVGVERPVNPGLHRIAVRVAGEVRARRDVSLVESETYQVELHLAAADPAENDASSAPHRSLEVKAKAKAAPFPKQTVGYVALGVAAVGFGIGTYSGLVALHHRSELDSACHPGCPARSANDLDAFRSNRTVSWVSYSVGVAAAAAGIVLLTWGSPGHEQLAISAFPSGVQIGGRL